MEIVSICSPPRTNHSGTHDFGTNLEDLSFIPGQVTLFLTMCLLSVVLLLPYFARGHAPLLVGSMGLTYSCLVLPMIISANYKYPLSGVRPFLLHATSLDIDTQADAIAKKHFFGFGA
uniref:Uncharacterized protein n=1 Tax=Timema cristinae TaxID=61476 RepID=A0A7R9CHS7_TIMCR|nr:unnamed protein product [Timema cristinae]